MLSSDASETRFDIIVQSVSATKAGLLVAIIESALLVIAIAVVGTGAESSTTEMLGGLLTELTTKCTVRVGVLCLYCWWRGSVEVGSTFNRALTEVV